MDDESKSRKLKEAERLRTKATFPFSLFSSPDYDASAEIFMEVGNMEEDISGKVGYYEEAARTYEMGDGEYGRYQASQVYERIAQMCEDEYPEKSIAAYKRSGMYSKQCGRESLAAISFQKASEMLRKQGDLNGCLECLQKVAECYCGSNWKHHKRKAMRDIADVYIDLGKYGLAAKIFLGFKENIYTFCAFLCHTIEGSPLDLDVSGDEKEVCDALERDFNEAHKTIEEYITTHAMISEVRKLLGIVKEKLKPENDIL
ncbi:putative soluble N-ethylmaleimide-sensitive factor [Encephalitozoon hellem]|nr:putative soluble N-ethylmaleimide-sensitive factor [Encephalitozoon hellem]